MQIATTNTIAKIAAVLAGLGLVASSFAAFAPAARAAETSADLQAQIDALLAQIASLQGSSSTSASVTFSRDLTLGSSGADVTALQNWLIKGGYAIPAGATGYFGAQTQAALAKYQAANGITPAAGYFGPITRAKVNAAAGGSTGGTGTGTGSGSSDGELSGGEANLTDFDLSAGEGTGDEGEEDVEIATAEFDVEDGDVRVERAELTFDAASSTLEDRPWQYFDSIMVSNADGDELGDVDASDRDEWDETATDVYTISLTGLDYVVDEDDSAELVFTANLADSIDEDDIDGQSFTVYVDDEGIRAVDSEGIQQYTGDDSDTTTFDFGEEDNGDLTVKSNDEDPDASILVGDDEDTSDAYDVFAFDIDNESDVDSIVNEITVGVTTGTGTNASNIIRTATLTVDGDEFDGDIASTSINFDDMDLAVDGDDRLEAVLSVELKANPVQTTLVFSLTGSTGVDAEGADSGDETDVSGTQTSSTHTVALTGVAVEPVSTSQSVTTPGDSAADTYGTYTIKFDVTAIEDDAYINDVAASTTQATNGATFALVGDTYTGPAASATLTSTADMSGGFYVVREGDTETFTLTVTLNPTTAGTFGVRLATVNFNDTAANYDTVFTVDSSNEDYRTDLVYIAN